MSVLSPAAVKLLQAMAAAPEASDDEDGNLLVDGIMVYFGTQRIHRITFNKLIRATAISPLYENGPYYQINTTGRAIARRPELADEVYSAIMAGQGAFSIVDDKLVALDRT